MPRLAAIWIATVVPALACGTETREEPRPKVVEAEPWWTAEREAPAGPPVPAERVVRTMRGISIWYGDRWHGAKTASGEFMDENAMTAAHRSLPIGTRVRVTNLANGRQVIVRINDRGPYGADRRRIIDVTKRAARELGFLDNGSTRVQLEVLADPPTAPH